MTRVRLIPLLLICLFAGASLVSGATAEDKAYDAALKSFDGGFWKRAEQEWKDFTIRFPQSPRLAEAVLFQGRALIQQTNFDGAVELLSDNLPQAGSHSDEYLFWIAEAQFREGRFTQAAETYARLTSEHPDSPRALEAELGEAAARARLKAWDSVISILRRPEGAFQKALTTQPTNSLVVDCQLLLAEAELTTRDYQAAEGVLKNIKAEHLNPTLDWRRQHLMGRIWLATDRLPEALAASTNLLKTARQVGQEGLIADTHLFKGEVLERMSLAFEGPEAERTNLVDSAVAAYRENLTTNAPPLVRRQTLLRLYDLLITQNRLSDAQSVVTNFIALDPEGAHSDLARMTLGELKLRQYVRDHPGSGTTNPPANEATNILAAVSAELEPVSQSATNALVRGRALLSLGWVNWLTTNFTASADFFQKATQTLPEKSLDQLIARYKWADAQFRLNDFEGAQTNYQMVADQAPSLGAEAKHLLEPALFQTLYAAVKARRPDLGTNALDRLKINHPGGELTGKGVLLLGQERQRGGDPTAAREVFKQYLAMSPQSPLAPKLHLGMASTYEAEKDWSGAIKQYDLILNATNQVPECALAAFFRAQDTALSGQETQAFAYFTNFLVAPYATNELATNNDLAARAQWWIGDYFWRQEDFTKAELNYQLVFKNWPHSVLAYPAQLKAGQAAMARARPEDAIPYFTNLTSDLSCPLRPQAMFAYGDALMHLPSSDTNNALANYGVAIGVFSEIQRSYPSNELAARALGLIGNCYYQLGAQDPHQYTNASNAFLRVIQLPAARVTDRDEAQFGMARMLESLAQLQSGEARTNLLRQALDRYLNVCFAEEADPFWVKKTGLEAGRLCESLQLWDQALKLYRNLLETFPALRQLIEPKILKVEQKVSGADR